jgi:xanthine dehydrogenase YagS FAD-binding subunit
MPRRSWAFALGSVALSLAVNAGRVSNPRIVLSAVANTPYRARAAEALLDDASLKTLDTEAVALTALADAETQPENRYKEILCRGLLRQALAELV